MSCWEPVRPACWCREESCSGPGAPWPARRCLLEQPSLCRWSLLLQHSSPISCFSCFSFLLNCTQNSVLLSAIKSFLGKSLSAQKSAGKGHSLTRKNIKEDFSIHVPLCLDCLPLALPGSLPLLRLCWCLSDIEDNFQQVLGLFWFEKAGHHHVPSWQSETLDLVTTAKNASVKVRSSRYKPAFFANRKAGRSYRRSVHILDEERPQLGLESEVSPARSKGLPIQPVTQNLPTEKDLSLVQWWCWVVDKQTQVWKPDYSALALCRSSDWRVDYRKDIADSFWDQRVHLRSKIHLHNSSEIH